MSRRNLGIPQINYDINMEQIVTWRPIPTRIPDETEVYTPRVIPKPIVRPKSVSNVIEIQRAIPKPILDQERVGMIQPGCSRDIILCLPIAKWYFEWGYEVIWPVGSEFLPLFDYASYVKAIDLGTDKNGYTAAIDVLFKGGIKKIVDLDIGLSRDEDSIDLHFDELKYKDAGVSFEERFNLAINRDRRKEERLAQIVMKKHGLEGKSYQVVQEDGHYEWKIADAIRIDPIKGFTIFDWLSIIENASAVSVIDSGFATLINQLGLCKDRRFIHYVPMADEDNGARKDFRNLVLSSDWRIVK